MADHALDRRKSLAQRPLHVVDPLVHLGHREQGIDLAMKIDDLGAIVEEEEGQHDDGDQGRDGVEGIRRHGGEGTDRAAQLARQRIELRAQALDDVSKTEGLGSFRT